MYGSVINVCGEEREEVEEGKEGKRESGEGKEGRRERRSLACLKPPSWSQTQPISFQFQKLA